jgi:hypothetical protein
MNFQVGDQVVRWVYGLREIILCSPAQPLSDDRLARKAQLTAGPI